jgi:hypothetical protein
MNYSYYGTAHTLLHMHENFSQNINPIFLFLESCMRQAWSYACLSYATEQRHFFKCLTKSLNSYLVASLCISVWKRYIINQTFTD